MLFAVLCTGPSMSQAVADAVRHLRVVAVNGSYELAPWADALAANDVNWWNKNPKALQFAGKKLSGNRIKGVGRIERFESCTCSGVLGLEVAKQMGAKKIILLGADFHGSHYFGEYANGLSNTTETRRRMHAAQFAKWKRRNPNMPVLNCTEGSRLECFPRMALAEALCE